MTASSVNCQPRLFTGYTCVRLYTLQNYSQTLVLAGWQARVIITTEQIITLRPKEVKVIFPVTELGLRPGSSSLYWEDTGIRYISELVSFKSHCSSLKCQLAFETPWC